MNSNQVVFAGFVASDPKTKSVGSRGLTEFSLAYNRKPAKEGDQPHTDFVAVKVWGRNAAAVYSEVRKGQPVIVSGPLRNERWQENGQNRERHVIEAFIVGRQIVAAKTAKEGEEA